MLRVTTNGVHHLEVGFRLRGERISSCCRVVKEMKKNSAELFWQLTSVEVCSDLRQTVVYRLG